MSDISKVDATEVLDIPELLNIPEDPEVIEVSDYTDIQLDKTNVETYMNDFNKNFYKIKFSKTLLKDYYELYKLENYGINSKDINETFVDEEVNNTTKDNKQIQPTPIGLQGVSPSINYTSNTIMSKNAKFIPPVSHSSCVGLSHSLNMTIFNSSNTAWTLKSGDVNIPIKLDLSIPSFRIVSPNIDLKGFGITDIIAYSKNCDEPRSKTVFAGSPCTSMYKEKRCTPKVLGSRMCSEVWLPKTNHQLFFKTPNYSPKELLNFNGLGVKFTANLTTNLEIKFQIVTNIPFNHIMSILLSKKNSIHKILVDGNVTTFNGIIEELLKKFDFEVILEIMILVFAETSSNVLASPYIDFYITYIKMKLNFNVNHITANYGTNSYSPSGLLLLDKVFEPLQDGRYISFSLNPSTAQVKAEFVFYQGKLHNLLKELSSPNTKTYINDVITPKGITGLFLSIIIIARENIEINTLEINKLTQQSQTQERKNYTDKNNILQNTINGILNLYDSFKTINYGNSSSVISKIIDEINPDVKLSIGVCATVGVAIFVSCASISLPKTNIATFFEDSIKTIMDGLPDLTLDNPIIDSIIDLIPSSKIKNEIRNYNNKINNVNNALNNNLANALRDVLAMLKKDLYVSPTSEYCIPL